MRRLLTLFVFGMVLPAITVAADAPKKIVLIAGRITGHPKHTHEYEKNVVLLKHLLDTSPNVKGLTVEAHFRGWPENEATLDDADTIVLISDGGDRNEAAHPLYVGNRREVLAKQMARGCGFVHYHWTTFHPSRFHDEITEWGGGYFDYETGSTPNKWFSAISTWTAPVKLGPADHPVLAGVKPFELEEEFYWRIRFRETDPRVTPLVLAKPPGQEQEFPVGWAVERANGGRSFGFTGGHFYKNWWLPDYRKLILNAIVWTAKADVPEKGVESTLGEPARALIVTGHNHPAHDWRKVTAALIPVLEQDPRLVVDVTENVEDLAHESLHRYDLVVLNYSSWDRGPLSAAARDNFLKWLRTKGGGLSVIHFANGAFTDTLPNKDADWPEYRTNIVRRIWVHGEGRSGHDAYGPFHVERTGVTHPITAGLAEFDTVDELYFKQEGPLPIEPLVSAVSKVTGKDEPLAWAYTYGKTRVFQTVLGHADISVIKAGALIRRGSAWAAGLTPLSFDPPVDLCTQHLFRPGSPWTLDDSLKRGGVATATAPVNNAPPLAAGKFGQALNARSGGVFVDAKDAFRLPPLTVECWAKVRNPKGYNILVAHESKASGTHWEIFTEAGNGGFTVYTPGLQPDHLRSKVNLCDDQWHYVAFVYEPERLRLYVDGKHVAEQAVKSPGKASVDGGLAIGSLVAQEIGCDGLIDEVRISRGVRDVSDVPKAPFMADETTLGLWRFDALTAEKAFVDESSHKRAAVHITSEAVKKK